MFYTLALMCLLSWVTWLSVEPGRPLHGPAVARRMNVTRRRWLWYAPSAVDFRYHDEFAPTSDVSLHCFVAYPRFLSCVSWQLFTSVAMLTCSRLLIILSVRLSRSGTVSIKTRDGFEDSMFEAKAKASDHDCWKKYIKMTFIIKIQLLNWQQNVYQSTSCPQNWASVFTSHTNKLQSQVAITFEKHKLAEECFWSPVRAHDQTMHSGWILAPLAQMLLELTKLSPAVAAISEL